MENYDERAAQTEDTWRPWEHRRYQVDRKIMQVEANVDPGPDYSVDFLEPNTALTPEAEIAVWEWRFNRGLATPKDWFLLNNPDYDQATLDEFEQRHKHHPTNKNQTIVY